MNFDQKLIKNSETFKKLEHSSIIGVKNKLYKIDLETYPDTIINVNCRNIQTGVCPVLWKSLSSLTPNLDIIGNVYESTGVLILNGENDTQTPVQQAFLLQQRLTDVNYLGHTLITYPDLGHLFYPSSQWQTGIGPIQQYVLADNYSWLEVHSGFTPLLTISISSFSSSSNNTKLNH